MEAVARDGRVLDVVLELEADRHRDDSASERPPNSLPPKRRGTNLSPGWEQEKGFKFRRCWDKC